MHKATTTIDVKKVSFYIWKKRERPIYIYHGQIVIKVQTSSIFLPNTACPSIRPWNGAIESRLCFRWILLYFRWKFYQKLNKKIIFWRNDDDCWRVFHVTKFRLPATLTHTHTGKIVALKSQNDRRID